MSQNYAVFWNKDDHKKLQEWWKSLNEKRDWRAELRRAEGPADVLLARGFRELTYQLAGYWTQNQNLLGLAAVAGILSHIKANDDQSFAKLCATPANETDKPRVSEARFSQLQKSRTLDELYTRMIRAINILRCQASVVSVADSILHWTKEMVDGEVDSDPRKRILVRWGLDYFQHLPKQKYSNK